VEGRADGIAAVWVERRKLLPPNPLPPIGLLPDRQTDSVFCPVPTSADREVIPLPLAPTTVVDREVDPADPVADLLPIAISLHGKVEPVDLLQWVLAAALACLRRPWASGHHLAHLHLEISATNHVVIHLIHLARGPTAGQRVGPEVNQDREKAVAREIQQFRIWLLATDREALRLSEDHPRRRRRGDPWKRQNRRHRRNS